MNSVNEIGKGAIKKERVFKQSWLDEDIFKGWLAPHPSDIDKALCTLCNIVIRCCKADLKRHAQTAKHINKLDFSHRTSKMRGNKVSSFFCGT